MAKLLVLQTSSVAQERIRSVVRMDKQAGARHDAQWLLDWDELRHKAQDHPAVVAIVDPYHSGSFAGFEIRCVRAGFPSMALIAYGKSSERVAGDLLELGRLGVAAVLTLGFDDDPASIQRSLVRATYSVSLARLVGSLRERLNPEAWALFDLVLKHAHGPFSVGELAGLVRDDRRNLHRRLTRIGLPSPQRLIVWCRLLHAARLMGDSDRSVNNVARSLDFSSESRFRHALKEQTALTPRQLMQRGGAEHLAHLFLKEARKKGGGKTEAFVSLMSADFSSEAPRRILSDSDTTCPLPTRLGLPPIWVGPRSRRNSGITDSRAGRHRGTA